MADNLRPETGAFNGAKGAVFLGDALLVIRRDVKPGLAFAGCWDFPGGGRESGETPRETMIREAREEVGLDLTEAEWLWQRRMHGAEGDAVWFHVLRLAPSAAESIRFGEEGQGWALMSPDRYLGHPRAIPALVRRLSLWLAQQKSAEPGQGSAP